MGLEVAVKDRSVCVLECLADLREDRDDLFELIADTIFSTHFKERGIFNQKEIETLYHMNQKGIQDNSLKLWQLIVFDLWMKTFIESSLPSIMHDPNELVMIQPPTEIPA